MNYKVGDKLRFSGKISQDDINLMNEFISDDTPYDKVVDEEYLRNLISSNNWNNEYVDVFEEYGIEDSCNRDTLAEWILADLLENELRN